MLQTLRTWVEIDAKALRHNAEQFFRLIPKETRLMAVIKSNAYGHGLVQVAKELLCLRIFRERGWFGVDSITEALCLRRNGIGEPILVLGYTLPVYFQDAVQHKITLTISTFDNLAHLAMCEIHPRLHLKIDTGMHRQGFLPSQIPELLSADRKSTRLNSSH